MKTVNRRTFSTALFTGFCASALMPKPRAQAQPAPDVKPTLKIALNTGTIRGYTLPLAEQIKQVAHAGYTGIEPWCGDIAHAAQKDPGLRDHAKQLAEHGLTLISAIGFAKWAVNDDATRKEGIEEMKRDMERVARLGGRYIAASPAGVNAAGYVLENTAAADRYRAILELGKRVGVTPVLEFWGASSNLNTLACCRDVAAATRHPDACILADVYHLYKGNSALEGLRSLPQGKLPILHVNDYPATPPRETIRDADRIWPGDGIAPFQQILAMLRETGADPWFSLELFNATYWKMPVAEMLRIGYGKVQKTLKKQG
jgi:2-keto-myo-inositol isomerase